MSKTSQGKAAGMLTTGRPGEPETFASSGQADDYAALTATVRELVQVMRDGGIEQLEVVRGDLKISLSARQSGSVAHDVAAPVIVPDGAAPAVGTASTSENLRVITSPMIGTFYAASAPGKLPFVKVGDEIEVGQTVAIVEAMKMMNEIVSDVAGTVVEILVRDAEAVEYGHPLMRVRPRR